jgi:hypothetical protein
MEGSLIALIINTLDEFSHKQTNSLQMQLTLRQGQIQVRETFWTGC